MSADATPPRPPNSRLIRASEVGEYVYCHRAWWLGRVQGLPNANRVELAAGVERHRAHGLAVARSSALARLARLLLVASAAASLIVLALWLGGVR